MTEPLVDTARPTDREVEREEEVALYSVADGVATITLNRPDRLNSFSMPLLRGTRRHLRTAAQDDAVKVVVLTGSGRAFCAGADTKTMKERLTGGEPQEIGAEQVELAQSILNEMVRLPKLVIAALNGVAAGAGLEVALGCDFRIARASAFFKSAAVGIGLVPGDGSCWMLPRIVGLPRALEMIFLEERIPAAQALEWGLVHRVVADDEFDAAVAELAGRLAQQPALAVGLTKRAVYEGQSQSLPETLLDLRQMVVETVAAKGFAGRI